MWSGNVEKKQLYGIEVKAASLVEKKNFNGLRYLRDAHPKKFTKGVL